MRVGAERTKTPAARLADKQPSTITESREIPRCGVGAEPIMAATASCESVPCTLSDGRRGESRYRWTRIVDSAGGEVLQPWTRDGKVCTPTEVQAPDLETLILQEFRSSKLPGLEVRTRPAGRTFVHLPTEFAVERPAEDRELPRILGHRVTVAITPVEYRWTFGDGGSATTAGRGGESVRHTYARAGEVAASVETAYRARYRVDGGAERKIPGTVAVSGPSTAVEVAQARTELVAGPR